MKKLMLPIIAVCCMAPAAVFASQQHPLVTDMAETVAPKHFEAETAVEYHSFDNHSITGVQETVTVGIIPKLDAFISVPISSVKYDGFDRETGFGDVIIGAKYNFMNVKHIELSVKPFLVLPTGDDNKFLGEGGVGVGAAAIASMELNKQLSFDGNLVLKHQETDRDSYNEIGVSAAAKYEVTRELKAVAELAISDNDESGSKTQAFITAGAIYEVQKNFEVDGGIRVGLTSDSEDFALLAGATFKF